MAWVFTLTSDGTGFYYAVSDEASDSMSYLTGGLTADMKPGNKFTWKIVGGTNGYAHDFVLSNSSKGTYEHYHLVELEDGRLGFYQCEAGGHYQRLP